MQWQSKTFAELTTDELYELLQLRMAVFMVEQTCYYQDIDDKDRHADTRHLLGSQDGRLCAYLRVLPPGLSYPDMASIGRVATARAVRGQGLGQPLMEHGMKLCQRYWPDALVKISAQSHLQHYYRRFGFNPTGEPYLEDDIPHIAMVASHTGSAQ